jgi:20S proteasome alpha/beta subunit
MLKDERDDQIHVASERLILVEGKGSYDQYAKVYQVGEETWFAAAGDCRAATIACKALKKFIKKKKNFYADFGDYLYAQLSSKTNDPTFSFLIIHEGVVYQIEDDCSVIQTDGPWAIGCGCDYALGYMFNRRGTTQTVVEAVRAAIHYDVNCGGEIDFVTVSRASPQPQLDTQQSESDEDECSHSAPDTPPRIQAPSL